MSVQYIRMIVYNQTELMTLGNMLVSHSLVQQGFKPPFYFNSNVTIITVVVVPNICLKLCFNLYGIAKLYLSGS